MLIRLAFFMVIALGGLLVTLFDQTWGVAVSLAGIVGLTALTLFGGLVPGGDAIGGVDEL